MLHQLSNKPLWYKLWAVSAALAAVYVLVRIFGGYEPTTPDRIAQIYALSSAVLNQFIYPKAKA